MTHGLSLPTHAAACYGNQHIIGFSLLHNPQWLHRNHLKRFTLEEIIQRAPIDSDFSTAGTEST